MEQSALAEVGLPVAVFLVMVVVGTSVDATDFRRLAKAPRALVVGLLAQLVALPLLGFLLAFSLRSDPILAVGMVLLAAAPGGATSNVIVHWSDGDRALSVTMTLLASTVTWISMPLLLIWAIDLFGGVRAAQFELSFFDVVAQIAAITLLPLVAGMWVRRRYPGSVVRWRKSGRIFSGVVLASIVIALLIENLQLVISEGPQLAPALVALNGAALALGYAMSKLARLGRRQAVTVAVETGIQNAALAITVALVTLDSAPLSVVPALYGLLMLITGPVFAMTMLRNVARTPVGEAT